MTLFTSYHNISHADGIFHGNSGYAAGISKWLRDGQPITAPFRYDWDNVAPRAGKTTGLLNKQTIKTVGTLTMNGTFISNGVMTMDVPRTVTLGVSTILTSGTFLFYGTDYYNEPLSEEIGITTTDITVNGKKAFKTVTCIAAKNTITSGTVSVGFSNIFGLPFACAGAWDVLAAWADTTAQTVDGTKVTAADTTSPATTKTGDARGTFAVTTTPDGSKKFRIWFTALGKDTRTNLYGVTPI